MECLNQTYDSIMSMPSGRRKRFCEEKEHLEKVREIRRKAR